MKPLIIIFFFVLLLVPITVISQNKITDMFVASTYSLAQKIHITGFYQWEPYQIGRPVGNWDWQGHVNGISHYPNIALLYAVLGLVTGVPLNVLVLMPLGILFMLTAFFAFAREILHNKLFIFAYILTIIFYFCIAYTLSYHTLGFFFHTLVLIILAKKLTGKLQTFGSSLILFILIGSTVFTYYTASAWNLILLVTITATLLIFKIRDVDFRSMGQKLNSILLLTLFTAILYFLIDTQFYKYILDREITGVLVNFVTYIINRLAGFPIPGQMERYDVLSYSPIARALSYVPLGMLLFSISFVFISLLIAIKSKRQILRSPLLIFSGLVVVGLSEAIVYFPLTQTIGNRYFQLYGLLIGFFAINAFLCKKRRNVGKMFLYAATVILTVLLVSSAFNNVYYRVFTGDTPIRSGVPTLCESSSNWLASYVVHNNIVAEHQLSGFLFMDIIRANKSDSVRVFPLNEDIYDLYESIAKCDEQTLSNLFTERTYHTIVFLKLFIQKPMFGDRWGYAVPSLNEQWSNLYNLTVLNIIYDDGNAVILDYNG